MWVTVRMIGTGQVIEMVPAVAEQLIAMGTAERVGASKPPAPITRVNPVVETAAIGTQETAVQSKVAFRLGPRSPRQAR